MNGILLHEAVHVDGDNLCTSCDDATRAEGVTEGVVGKLVPKTAAGGKAVDAVRHIDKEAVSFLHLPCAVSHKFRVSKALLCGEEADGKNGEGEQLLVSFLPEPLHKEQLKFARGLHIDLRPVGVVEAPEHFLHVGTVKDADVPEYGLISTRTGGLVERIDDALKFLLDVVLMRLEVVLAVGLAGKVVEHVKELHCCDCPCEVAGNLIDEVHEATAEAL